MPRQVHRVRKGPKHVPAVPMPKDCWRGSTFIEAATGEEFEVKFSGKYMPCSSIERTSNRCQTHGNPLVRP